MESRKNLFIFLFASVPCKIFFLRKINVTWLDWVADSWYRDDQGLNNVDEQTAGSCSEAPGGIGKASPMLTVGWG